MYILSNLQLHTHTLLFFSGQLSREHSVIMSCSTFMTDGKCAARRALLLPSLLHSTSPGSPDHLPVGPAAAPARRRIKWSGRANERRSRWELRQWKNRLSPPHQYCSLTWWKLTPANIFHHVIGREDQMPWLDMPTLLPVQMMTQSSLHYSWLL